MARKIIRHSDISEAKLTYDEDALHALEAWLQKEIANAIAARKSAEAVWRTLLRQYNGIPTVKQKSYPIEGVPNIEVTIGAIAADSIFAQAMDLKWVQTSPLVSVRPSSGRFGPDGEKTAKALQTFINHVAIFEANAKEADECATLDTVQLGTGVFYIPWVERIKETKTAKVVMSSPCIIPVPVEDFLTPAGASGEIEDLPWVGIRFLLTEEELRERSLRDGWELSDLARPTGGDDWVKKRREYLAHEGGSWMMQGHLYDIYEIYCYYDIDGDGVREDLYIIWNHSSGKVLRISYNPFDCRPVVIMRYQRRPHMILGLGVLEMMRPYEEEVTSIHNERIANMMIANCRHWVGREGVIPDSGIVFYPNSLTLVPNPRDDLVAIQLGDVYPSSVQAETMTMMLAERRVGVNEMSMPRPSSIMGSRTPGITALSLLQQVNRRFTPAFDAMREGLGGAIRQCVLRYREQLLAGNLEVREHIANIMGLEDAMRIIDALLDDNFDESFSFELTASSVSINREADRQNAVMLTNLLGQYYERAIQLVMVAANPQIPQAVREVAVRVAEKANEIMDRTVRTFEQIKDPGTFVLDFSGEIREIIEQSQEDAMRMAVASQLASLGGQPAGGGLLPQPSPTPPQAGGETPPEQP